MQNTVRFIKNIISNTTVMWGSLFTFIYGIIYLKVGKVCDYMVC